MASIALDELIGIHLPDSDNEKSIKGKTENQTVADQSEHSEEDLPKMRLGKRVPRSPSPVIPPAGISEEARVAMNLVAPLIELEQDELTKEAKRTKKWAFKRLRKGVNSLIVSTAKLSTRVRKDPTFDKNLDEIPRQAIDDLNVVDDMDVIINTNEELKKREVKRIQRECPRPNQLTVEQEKFVASVSNRPEYINRAEYKRRYNLDTQMEEAFTFFHSTVRKLGTSFGLPPTLCVKCWSILFCKDSLITFGKAKVRIKVPCSEVFAQLKVTTRKQCKEELKQWQDCARALDPKPEGEKDFHDHFPTIILPADSLLHHCWDMDSGAERTDFKDWKKHAKYAFRPSTALSYLQGKVSPPVEVSSALSNTPNRKQTGKARRTKNKSPVKISAAAIVVDGTGGNQSGNQQSKEQQTEEKAKDLAADAQPGDLPVGAPDRKLKDLVIEVPDGSVSEIGKDNRDSMDDFIEDDLPKTAKVPRKKKKNRRARLSASGSLTGASRALTSPEKSSEVVPANPARPPITKDLKDQTEGWQWLCYERNGEPVRIPISELTKAWVEK